MTTLVQIRCDQSRRYDRNTFLYHKLMKKGKGLLAMRFLNRAERNLEAVEEVEEVMKGAVR
ncbi:hypothetical protein [Nitratireductor indicus]|uniref:hypothetical protein n=1 Tax=Nitratireductor indicus TaxID=721133 RepID=UPI0028768661|nr:hypothetical protein [Nitratireductor indicus]MDS1138608.1 hypothetical protein [Nitratireductor indicus]